MYLQIIKNKFFYTLTAHALTLQIDIYDFRGGSIPGRDSQCFYLTKERGEKH